MYKKLIIIYLSCFSFHSRRRRKPEKPRGFNHLPPNHDVNVSKYSHYTDHSARLDASLDTRLPKVGSSGLWMGGAPSMYAPPSKGFIHDQQRRQVYPNQPPMQRAHSEDRLTSRKCISSQHVTWLAYIAFFFKYTLTFIYISQNCLSTMFLDEVYI